MYTLTQQCQQFTRVSTAVDVHTRALPVFDATIARDVAGPSGVQRVCHVLVHLLTAERDNVATLTDQADHRNHATTSAATAAQQLLGARNPTTNGYRPWQRSTTRSPPKQGQRRARSGGEPRSVQRQPSHEHRSDINGHSPLTGNRANAVRDSTRDSMIGPARGDAAHPTWPSRLSSTS
jgi:hypothetical protein